MKKTLRFFLATIICLTITSIYPFAIYAETDEATQAQEEDFFVVLEETISLEYTGYPSEIIEFLQEYFHQYCKENDINNVEDFYFALQNNTELADEILLEAFIYSRNSEEQEFLRQLVDEYDIKTLEELVRVSVPGGSVSSNAATSFAQDSIQSANNALAQIGSAIKGLIETPNGDNVADGVVGIDYMGFARNFESTFKIIAYTLVLVCWGVGIIESAFQYELMTAKGLFKVFGKVLLAKIWIDLAVTICEYVINICVDITIGIINAVENYNLHIVEPDYSELVHQSGIWIIGDLIDIIVTFFTLIPVLIVTLLAYIIAGIVIIKLIMRTFELAMIVTVSPVFFACAVSEATSSYFKRFIGTLIGVAAQIIFIAIVYSITVSYIPQHSDIAHTGDIVQYMAAINMWIFIVIAMGIMMIKPPRILTNLVG